MADFNTHLGAASAVGALGAMQAIKLLETPPEIALLLMGCTAVGGVLPDIDLRASIVSRSLFTLLGLIAAVVWALPLVPVQPSWILLGGGTLLFLLVRYPLAWLFDRFTVHRGSLHSILAAVCFTLGVAVALSRHVQLDEASAWLCALGIGTGYLIHLLLDELYSIDVSGVRIRRSFGSALKLFDTQRLAGSILLLFLTGVLWFYLPPWPQSWTFSFSSVS